MLLSKKINLIFCSVDGPPHKSLFCQYLESDPPPKKRKLKLNLAPHHTRRAKVRLPQEVPAKKANRGGEEKEKELEIPSKFYFGDDYDQDSHLDEYTRRKRRRWRKEREERKGEHEHDLGSEALNFIDYAKRDLTFVQEFFVENKKWTRCKIKSLDFSSYQPFVRLLMYQKKGKWLFWGCEGAILKLVAPAFTVANPKTVIWCGQGSPFVDRVPNVADKDHNDAVDRQPVRLNNPQAVPAQVPPYTYDRLQDIVDWARDPDKGNKGAIWRAHMGCMDPARSPVVGYKDVWWGSCATEYFVLNPFKNETDIRCAYMAEWERMGGNIPAPNQLNGGNNVFPHNAEDLTKADSYSSNSRFQSIKAPWLKIDLHETALPPGERF